MKKQTRRIALIAMYVALAVVLNYLKEMMPFLNMPNGGSVDISLIPLVVGALHLGVADAMLMGILFWFITFVMGMNNYFINYTQYGLDYIIPAFAVGFAGLGKVKTNKLFGYLGIVLMMLVKYVSVLLSGAYFWMPSGEAAGSALAWINTFTYNTGYNVATLVILLVFYAIFEKTVSHKLLK